MEVVIQELIKFLSKNGVAVTNIFWILIIIIGISQIDNILLLLSKIYGLFASASTKANKNQISLKVRGTILKSVKKQGLHNTNIIPDDLKVVWVNEEACESFIDNQQVIVRIKQSTNPHENLIVAVSEYINSGLLYNVRRYLNQEVLDASKVLMTRKIIEQADTNSLTYLEEHYIMPKLDGNSELKELYEDLIRIDNNGMFVDIMLNEFNKAGMSLYKRLEDPELFAESKEFMRFLYNIASGVSTNAEDLKFNRDYFKVAIILSASNKTLNHAGITPFVNAVFRDLSDGIETIYILGLGTKRDIAQQISEAIGNDYRIDRIIKHTYKHVNETGRRVPGVFFECCVYKDIETDHL